MARRRVKQVKFPTKETPVSRFPFDRAHIHNDADQPAGGGLRKKFVQVRNDNIRIDFRGGGHMILGFVGKDNSGNEMFGILINDGTKDRIFEGVQKDGF